MDAQQKLEILADASRFDLSCACGTKKNDDHRRRAPAGTWLYPVSLPSGGTSIILKTLQSSSCINDCAYCPFRAGQDAPRCTLSPEEVARVTVDYFRRGKIFGLFLSSGVVRGPDHTMDRMIAAARLLRGKHGFRGYIHLKVIPGASDAAVEAALRVSSAVSLNVEVPRRAALRKLSAAKDYDRDIVRPLKLISRLTARGARYSRVKQSTQFIVGAADEVDTDIVGTAFRLYKRQGMNRVYYSAYQRGLGDPAIPGEQAGAPGGHDLLTREHRLYQADYLIRKYGFDAGEIPFEAGGNLSLAVDPKELWAERHPGFFPLDVNKAEESELLRVPGFGPVTVERILELRKNGSKLRSLAGLGRPGKRLRKAERYVKFGHRRPRLVLGDW